MRAGDVIPKVIGLAVTAEESLESGNQTSEVKPLFELPKHCPSCGSPTARDVLRATNTSSTPKKSNSSGASTSSDSDLLDDPAVQSLQESVGVRCTGGFSCPAQAIEQIRQLLILYISQSLFDCYIKCTVISALAMLWTLMDLRTQRLQIFSRYISFIVCFLGL